MKVGDLVLQLGWEADGVGLVTKTWNAGPFAGGGPDQNYATVLWSGGECEYNMNWDQLKVINESR